MPYFEENYAWDKAYLYFYSHQESCLGLESNPWSSVATCHWPSCVWLVQPRRIVSQLNFLSNLEKKMGEKNYEDDQNCPVWQSSPIWLSEEFFESSYFRIEQRVVLLHILIFVLADCHIISGQDKKKINVYFTLVLTPTNRNARNRYPDMLMSRTVFNVFFYISPPLSRIN